LFHRIQFFLSGVHFEGFVESEWINFFEDGLQSNQGLLENLMPMVRRQINDDWNQHWECFLLVRLQNVEEVVILKEAHGSVTDMHILTSDTSDHSFEEFWDEMLHS
jgi:hypothetical protein